MEISELYRYPLKGGKAETLSSTKVLETGFPQDRRWVLVDAAGRFITQREQPLLALIKVDIGQALQFQFREETLQLPQTPILAHSRKISVWSDHVEAADLGDEAADFFSRILQKPVRLCEANAASERRVKADYTDARTVHYLFADAFPYLIISQESLDLLNEKLREGGHSTVGIDRFRTNIVIKGWEAHAEDKMQTIRIGSHVRLRLAKLCTRCNVTQVNQDTAEIGQEPLATLARYRKVGGSKINFGVNAWLVDGAGQDIRLGDPVIVE